MTPHGIPYNFPMNHFKLCFITVHAKQSFNKVLGPHFQSISGSVNNSSRSSLPMEFQADLPPELDAPPCDDILADVKNLIDTISSFFFLITLSPIHRST